MSRKTKSNGALEGLGARTLDYSQTLLLTQGAAHRSFAEHLSALTALFAADSAGLWLVENGGVLRSVCSVGGAGEPFSDVAPSPLPRLAAEAAVLLEHEGHSWLVAAHGVQAAAGWVLALGRARVAAWTECERACLALVNQALARLGEQTPDSCWGRLLRRWERQRMLDLAAVIAAKLAHDFGNAFTGIVGFSDLARKLPQPGATLRQYLDELAGSAQSGADWVRRLQQCSRGGLGAGPAACSVQEIVQILAGGAEWSGPVRLEVDVPEDLPLAAMDGACFQDALGALLTNAREAMDGQEAGVVRLTAGHCELSADDVVSVLGTAPAGTCLQIVVTDDGPGLAREAQERLFVEPFFSSKPRRRGLGLSMAYRLVRAFGGGLTLGRAPGGGVCTRLLLPLAPAELRVPHAPAASGAASILVVDDDRRVLEIMRLTLEQAGHSVHAVDDPRRALDLTAAGSRFDLVLTDILMSPMSGFDLARRFLELQPDVPLVFVSSQPSFDGLAGQELLRRFPLVCKPFEPHDLVSVVRETLKKSGAP